MLGLPLNNLTKRPFHSRHCQPWLQTISVLRPYGGASSTFGKVHKLPSNRYRRQLSRSLENFAIQWFKIAIFVAKSSSSRCQRIDGFFRSRCAEWRPHFQWLAWFMLWHEQARGDRPNPSSREGISGSEISSFGKCLLSRILQDRHDFAERFQECGRGRQDACLVGPGAAWWRSVWPLLLWGKGSRLVTADEN